MQRDCSAEMILCDDFGGEVVDEWGRAFFRGDFERRTDGGEHASFASDGERSYSRETGHPDWGGQSCSHGRSDCDRTKAEGRITWKACENDAD